MTEVQSNIAQRINETYEAACHFAQTAKTNAMLAINAAIQCGTMLNEAHESAGKGDWGLWLESNCPQISRRTAYNYMKLASVQTLAQPMTDLQSLKQAYIAAGILPEPEREEPGVRVSKDSYVLHINRLCQHFNKTDVNTLDDTTKTVLKEQLKPLHELYERL